MKYVPMEIKKLVLIMKVRYLLLNLLMIYFKTLHNIFKESTH